ncbi:MAG: hypothetical protein HPY64_04985 [Anaerolineae bacterium]|nr:hypothetical protein [Anaerolineae bacterium]
MNSRKIVQRWLAGGAAGRYNSPMVRRHSSLGLAARALFVALLALPGGIVPQAQAPVHPVVLLLQSTSLTSEQHWAAEALAGVLQNAAPPWLHIAVAALPAMTDPAPIVERVPLVVLVQPCTAAADCQLWLRFLPTTPPARGLITPTLQDAILNADPPTLAYQPGQETLATDLVAGLAAYATDRCAAALPHLDQAAGTLPEPHTLAFYRARCRHARHDYTAAFDLLRVTRPALLAANPDPALLALWNAAIADALAQNFAFDRALAWDDRAIRAARRSELIAATSRQLLAELYLLRGQHRLYLYEWDAVLADYNHALSLLPDLPRAYYLRGLLYYTQNQRAAAYADLTRFLALETNLSNPLLPLGRQYADDLTHLLATPAPPP